jgi:hypothetical protein
VSAGIGGAFSFFGLSTTIAAVVIRRLATDARPATRCAHDLGRVDDAELIKVAVLVGLSVVAVSVVLVLDQLADHNSRVDPLRYRR